MNFNEYIESKRVGLAKKKIPQEIRERWMTRIVQRSLQKLGRSGAIQYLADYGKGIAAPKVICFALVAESEGYPEMASGFWAKAFELETGEKALNQEGQVIGSSVSTPMTSLTAAPPKIPDISELPPNLQPGRIVTMQPVDAAHERQYYIDHSDYWGQPKRDGHRLLAIATKSQIFYQSRSTRLRESPTPEIEQALLTAVAQLGTFVLDGEIYWRSAVGSEHRTSAQAATANIESNQPKVQPQPVYAIFSAMFFNGRDLTSATQVERIDAGVAVGEILSNLSKEFEIVPTAKTKEEKLLLVEKQHAEDREGEIWVKSSCRYVGGKDIRTLPIVRTKYCQEIDLVVIELTPTTAERRPFGAIEVAKEVDGFLVPLGLVGAGFALSDMHELVRRHAANPNRVKITVRTQGLTESGQLWHGRFLAFCSDSYLAPLRTNPDNIKTSTIRIRSFYRLLSLNQGYWVSY